MGTRCLALACLLWACACAAFAQGTYPSKPVRLVVPAAPGGNPDVLARLMAQKLSPALGASFVVDNQPGSGGIAAAIGISKSAPDGYTLFLGDSGAMAIGVAMNPKLPYHPLKDFTLITALAAVPTLLVAHPGVPAGALQEFIALAKAQPGKVNFGSAGVGSIHHLTLALFELASGTKMLHVPYKGGAPLVAAIMAGEVQAGFSGIPNVLQAIRSGKLKTFGISLAQRSPSVPDIPTLDQQGLKGFDVASTIGLQAAAGVPRPIVATLQGAVARALREQDIAARMSAIGMVLLENGTDEYVQSVKGELQRYAAAVKAAGIRFE
ncbi:MAG: tripartite tricarboxylate transporter substrate binding protein [Burkholderiales bacterium]|nr:tripartite tricarboxylate transporter substrate binding protein [Burkholderiales bacterium]